MWCIHLELCCFFRLPTQDFMYFSSGNNVVPLLWIFALVKRLYSPSISQYPAGLEAGASRAMHVQILHHGILRPQLWS